MKLKQNQSAGNQTKITINPEQVICLFIWKEISFSDDWKTIDFESAIRTEKQDLTNTAWKARQVRTYQDRFNRQRTEEQWIWYLVFEK